MKAAYIFKTSKSRSSLLFVDHEEGHKLLKADEKALNSLDKHIGELPKNCFQGKRLTAYGGRAPGPVNPDSLYEGIKYKCAYLGSTQLISTSRYAIKFDFKRKF